jgi:O-antigen/teichoic acid export membrane protein
LSEVRPTTRVARGTTYIFVQGFAGSLISLVYFIALARTFSAPSDQWEMGVYALLSFILALAQSLAPLALPSASIKYISQHLAEGDSVKAKSVVARVLQIGLLVSIVAFLALFLPAEWLSTLLFGTPGNALLFRLLAVCSVFQTLFLLVSAFLQGMQRWRDVAVTSLASTSISALVGIPLLLSGWRLYAVVIGWLTGLSVAFVAAFMITAKRLGVLGKPYPIRPLMIFSFPLCVSGGIGLFAGWVDQLLLALFLGQTSLGIYYVAVRASNVPAMFSNAIASVIFPQMSELYAQQGSTSLKDAFRVTTRYAIIISFPLVIGLATLAYPMMVLFGGPQYAGATVPLIIICIATLASTLGVTVSPILMTLERTITASLLSITSVALSLSLVYIALVPLNLGMIGTAWARALASVIALAFMLYVLSRHVPLSFDREALWKASAASAFMVFAIVGLDLVRKILASDSYRFLAFRLSLLPIYVVVGGVAYVFALAALRGFKKNDIVLLEEYMPKRLRPVIVWLGRVAKID